MSPSIIKYIQQEFRFLGEEYGFRQIQRKKNTDEVIYKDSDVFVRVSYDKREDDVFVYIGKLVNGNIPEYPIFITKDTDLFFYEIDDIKSLSDTGGGDTSRLKIDKKIKIKAVDTKKYANKILQGNFSCFPKLEHIVKSRVGN